MVLKQLLIIIALPVSLILDPDCVFGQTKTITGQITDSKDSKALLNVSIVAKGTKIGTQTDVNGHFSLTVPSSLKTLTISSVGFVSQDVDVSKTTYIEVILVNITSTLDEVVVIGYGTSRRKDVTGAVTKLSIGEFNKGVITNPLQQLQGKVAGMVITQPGGDPNGDFIVRIRGATSLEGQPPLLVIDGVAIDSFNKAIITLNPSDIESFDILKDASAAAIYGSRGGNGVVIITTKSGRPGKTLIDYDAFVSLEKISNVLDVLTADQWRHATGTGGASLDKGGNTDWQKIITRTAISHSHSIGLSGGSNQINFRGSIGYTKQNGIIINTGKEVFTARLSANQKNFNDKLEVRYDINSSVVKRDFLPDQSSTSQVRTIGSFFLDEVLHILPVWPVYNPDGSYFQGANQSIATPVYILKEVYSKKRENFFQSSVKADYELTNEMKAGILGAISRGNDVYDFFNPGVPDFALGPISTAKKANDNKLIFSGNFHANYRKNFGKHSLDITGTYEYNKFVNDGFAVTATGFLVRELLNNNLGTATNIRTSGISSYKNEVKLISFLGRSVYNFADKYILTANFRRDGSSKFGPNHRWGNFPSVAIAWRIINEKFLKNIKWLDNLKLRISYGLTGNQENLPPNSYQLLYGPSGPYLYNGQFLQSYAVTQENNPDLKWEVRKSFNVGVDFSVWDNHIYGTIDVFNDKTSDMLFLYDLPQPPFLTNKVYANAANAVNKGIELTVGAEISRGKKFDWKIQGNIATLKNRITNLSGQFKGTDLSITNRHYGYANGRGLGFAYVTQLQVGYPAGIFWVPEHAGFDQAGHELYNNYDANGKLIGTSTTYADQDRVFIDPTPHFTWSLTNNFSYKNFDLSFMMRGVHGQKIFANSLLNLESTVYLPSSNVTPKALTNGFTDQPQPSDYWIRAGSFIRLENLTVSYDLKKLKGINRMKLFVTGTNLFLITSYDGIDPEINVDGSQRYIDLIYYPKTRSFTLGVNLGL